MCEIEDQMREWKLIRTTYNPKPDYCATCGETVDRNHIVYIDGRVFHDKEECFPTPRCSGCKQDINSHPVIVGRDNFHRLCAPVEWV